MGQIKGSTIGRNQAETQGSALDEERRRGEVRGLRGQTWTREMINASGEYGKKMIGQDNAKQKKYIGVQRQERDRESQHIEERRARKLTTMNVPKDEHEYNKRVEIHPLSGG